MTFDEVIEIIWGDALGVDVSGEYGKYDFLIKFDGVATGREALNFLIRELKDTYMPTIEMTQTQYDVFRLALAKAKVHEHDFVYFIDILETEDRYNHCVLQDRLMEFTSDSRWFMQAWLHPEMVKVVDDERN